MNKAVGRMLFEVGKRDERVLVSYLKAHYPTALQTTLSYAIERFAAETRRAYLQGEF